jgi:Raf kinase inhibitor-like YbhB/YbcL family protein
MRIFSLMIIFLLGIMINTIAPAADTALTLTTNAFLDASTTPVLYTCDGKDIPPELSWTNVPAKTQSFVLIASDSDASKGVWYHWVVYNIPKHITKLEEGASKLPAGTLTGKNSWNKTHYNGPCPSKGSTHKYVFTLYALDTTLSLSPGATAKEVMTAMQKHIVQQAQLSTVYSRWLV